MIGNANLRLLIRSTRLNLASLYRVDPPLAPILFSRILQDLLIEEHMFNDLECLRDSVSLCTLLTHYANPASSDRQAWQDRLMHLENCEPNVLTRMHGELIAFGWLEQNTGLTPTLRAGEVPLSYRITTVGLRTLKQLQQDESEAE